MKINANSVIKVGKSVDLEDLLRIYLLIFQDVQIFAAGKYKANNKLLLARIGKTCQVIDVFHCMW